MSAAIFGLGSHLFQGIKPMSKLKSGSCDITLLDKLNSLTDSLLPLMKDKGAPIIGLTDLKFDPRYAFTYIEDKSKVCSHITWSPLNELQ